MRALLLLAVAACGCSHAFAEWQPAILRSELPPDKNGNPRGAITVCAENNVPYVVIDSATAGTIHDEGLRVHEVVHVRQALAYRGGCWPYFYRYASDSAFRYKAELEAYCAWGRWAITRNFNPNFVWTHVRETMRERYGAAPKVNCLYEEP